MSYLKLNWTNDLSVGVRELDDQHKNLIDYINRLYLARANDDRGQVNELLTGLCSFTIGHFAIEEDYLRRAEYKHLDDHLEEHSRMLKTMRGLANRYSEGEDVAFELQVFLRDWLMHHIIHIDALYIPALNEFLNRDKDPTVLDMLKTLIGIKN